MSAPQFDDLIRGKLAAARHEGTPDWARLRDELSGAAFDELLGAGLAGGRAGLPGDTAVPDWDGLSAKLDHDAEASGDAFDRLIARRVAHATADDLAPAASWRQLSHRMDTLWPLRRRLARYRVLEIAAAALLLLTFLPLLRDNAALPPGGPNDLATAVGSPGVTGTVGEFAGASQVLAQAASPAGAVSPREAADADGGYDPLGNLAAALGWREEAPRVLTPAELAARYGTDRLALGPDRRDATVRATPPPAHPFVHPAVPVTTPAALPLPRALTAVEAAFAPGGLTIPALAGRDNPWSFGAGATRKTWRVSTPEDIAFDRASSVQSVAATAIGAHVLRDLSPRWRLGLSVATASARYDAGLPTVQRRAAITRAGYDLAEDFRGIDLDVALATLDARVGLLPAGRAVQVWAKAGLGATGVLRAAYDLRRVPAGAAAAPSANGFSGAEAFPAKPAVEKAFTPTDLKDFSRGLLQGGALTENTQFFGRVGLEAELGLGERLRVFGAADLDAALPGQAGFGPNRDAFGGYGLEVGARISL